MNFGMAGAVLVFYGVLLAVGVVVVVAVVVPVVRGSRLPGYAWLLTGAVLVVLAVTFWFSLLPVETVDGLACPGVARDYLFEEHLPGTPHAPECAEESRIRVAGWPFLAGLLLVPWLVVMLSGMWRKRSVPGTWA